MKKKKNFNKINVKIMPLPLRHLNISNIKKDNPDKNNKNSPSSKPINIKNRIKSSSIKVNKNIYKANPKPKRLNTINIIDKKIDIIYDWNILLNNKSNGIYYNKNDYKKLSINNFETESNIPKNSIILLDLPDNEIKKYFGKKTLLQTERHPKTAKHRKFLSKLSNNIESNGQNNSQNNNNILDTIDSSLINSNHLHPKSIYTPREPHQPFYFSNDFNDYYKHDIKYFVDVLPSLQAKIKTSNKKLMKEIINLKSNTIKDSLNLKQFFEKDEKIFKVQDLIIAGIRNNPARLMNNLYSLKHPNYKKVKQDMKMYFKTMKPIGEYFGEIDFTKNERWKMNREIKKIRKKEKIEKRFHTLDKKDNKTNLILSYYKVTDPHIKYFNKLIKKYSNSIKDADIEENNFDNKGFSFNKKFRDKMTETENEKNKEFFRDMLFNNINMKNKNLHTGKEHNLNYGQYFITETTKNSINE